MKEIDPEHWLVALTLDHAAKTYTVRQVAKYSHWGDTPPFYVVAESQDEIGASNEARRTLDRLGFSPAE